jgi:hypothetical protein
LTNEIPSDGSQLSIPWLTVNLVQIVRHFPAHLHSASCVAFSQAPPRISSPASAECKSDVQTTLASRGGASSISTTGDGFAATVTDSLTTSVSSGSSRCTTSLDGSVSVSEISFPIGSFSTATLSGAGSLTTSISSGSICSAISFQREKIAVHRHAIEKGHRNPIVISTFWLSLQRNIVNHEHTPL